MKIINNFRWLTLALSAMALFGLSACDEVAEEVAKQQVQAMCDEEDWDQYPTAGECRRECCELCAEDKECSEYWVCWNGVLTGINDPDDCGDGAAFLRMGECEQACGF